MKSILGRFRKRNIQTNFYHFVLVIFVVAVSVCLIAGLFINYLTLNKSVNQYFEHSNLPNLWVETSQITREDEEFFASKFEFDKRFKFTAKCKTRAFEYDSLLLISGGDVSNPYIVEGERGQGCYVDSKFAEKNNFSIGVSTVSFDFEFDSEIKKLTLKIAGFISMAEDFVVDGNSVIFIDEDYFLGVLKNNFDGLENADLSVIKYNEILITSDVKSSDVQEIESYYNNSSSNLVSIQQRETLNSVVTINSEIKTAKNMLWIFPIIFVIISVLVIYSAISQLVLKERYNLGLLKSLGISNKQIISSYCGYGVTIGFIGAILGLLVAPLIIPNMTFEIYDKLYNLPREEVSLLYPFKLIIATIFGSIFCGYFSSFFVILGLVSKTPKECMSKFSKIPLNSRKIKRRIPSILGAPLRNMKINLARTIMSIVGIAGSSLLILLGYGVDVIKKKNVDKSEFFAIEVFARVFKGFSIVLLILTIAVLLVQIFKERQQEMAVLRIHGESYVKIWVSVLLEMLFICLVGFVFSILLSGPAMLLNLRIFGISGYFYIGFWAYLKAFLIIFLSALLLAALGLIKIYKLKLSESIKFSE